MCAVVNVRYLSTVQTRCSEVQYTAVPKVGINGFIQWLKYKFGAHGNSEKIGALLYAGGAPFNLLIPVTAVWGLGTLASNFTGPGMPLPRVPPYFNHWIYTPKLVKTGLNNIFLTDNTGYNRLKFDRCNPWPHVFNRHISISQLLSS